MLTAAIQEALVSLLFYDEDEGAKVVRAIIGESKVFDSYYRELAAGAITYIDQYKKSPQEHTIDIIDVIKANRPDEAEVYDKLFESILEGKDVINREYVLANARRFVEYQRIRRGLSSALDALELKSDDNVDLAKNALRVCLKDTDDVTDIGMRLGSPESMQFDDDIDHVYPTGVAELDAAHLGPARGTMQIFMAPRNRGKSWWTINCGKHGILNRARVVHVTLEMSETKVAMRYMQTLFSLTKREASRVGFVDFEKDDLGRVVDMSIKQLKKREGVMSAPGRKVLAKKVKQLMQRSPLWIKRFPTGGLTMNGLNGYLDTLEAKQGVVPDILIVDYPDLFKTSPATYRHDIGQIYKDLRGVAVERNCAVIAPSQSNRESEGIKLVTRKQTSEDISKTDTADVVITYSQTSRERSLGLARLFVDKARDEANDLTVLVSQAYGVGQFCLRSARMSGQRYWDLVKEATGDEDTDEDDK